MKTRGVSYAHVTDRVILNIHVPSFIFIRFALRLVRVKHIMGLDLKTMKAGDNYLI